MPQPSRASEMPFSQEVRADSLPRASVYDDRHFVHDGASYFTIQSKRESHPKRPHDEERTGFTDRAKIAGRFASDFRAAGLRPLCDSAFQLARLQPAWGHWGQISQSGWKKTGWMNCAHSAATTALVSTPICSISTSTRSPGCRNTGGVRATPTPGGVPVKSKSPTSSVHTCET